MNKKLLVQAVALAIAGWHGPIPAATFAPIKPDTLMAVDQNRTTVVEGIVANWGPALEKSASRVSQDQLRTMLYKLRADHLLAASLAGSLSGLRDVLEKAATARDTSGTVVTLAAGGAKASGSASAADGAAALGSLSSDLVYNPVTPCRLVETRPASFSAVYQGAGAFAPGEVRNYVLQSGNGVCMTQLPSSVKPSAVVLQVFGIPTSSGSGDIEVLPFGRTFGSTATQVFLGNNPFTSTSTTTEVDLVTNEISVQVRAAPANLAIDLVGYFLPPQGGFVSSVTAGTGVTVSGTAADPIVGITGSYQLPQTCTNGQTAISNGAGGWTCGVAAGPTGATGPTGPAGPTGRKGRKVRRVPRERPAPQDQRAQTARPSSTAMARLMVRPGPLVTITWTTRTRFSMGRRVPPGGTPPREHPWTGGALQSITAKRVLE